MDAITKLNYNKCFLFYEYCCRLKTSQCKLECFVACNHFAIASKTFYVFLFFASFSCIFQPHLLLTYVSVDYWKVLIISGTYTGEPADSDQLHAAAAGDDVNAAEADSSDKPETASEIDTSSNQGDNADAESQPQNKDGAAAENTNNNADSDSDDDKFSKKHSKSSKYFVAPRPPISPLVLVIYGDLGKTRLLPLTADNPQDVSFEAGRADEFKVSQHVSLLGLYGRVIYVA